MNNNEKKILLIKKNKCKELKENYLKKILSIITTSKEEIVFIDIEESASFKESTNRIGNVNQSVKEYSHSSDIEEIIVKEIKDILKGDFYIYIDHDWEYCGAIHVSTIEHLNDKITFGKYIMDDVLFISRNQRNTILVDYYEMNNRYFIELTIREKNI